MLLGDPPGCLKKASIVLGRFIGFYCNSVLRAEFKETEGRPPIQALIPDCHEHLKKR
jgi:hypothetical protein